MGIVIRQSLKFTIINILLVLIGGLSVLYVYPKNLSLYGELNMFYFTANLLLPITSLGFSNIILKYYQTFKERGYASDYLSFSLVGTNIFACLGLLLFILFKNQVLLLFNYFHIPQDFVSQHYYLIALLSLFLINNATFTYYSSIQKRIVIPEIITNGGYKLLLPTIIFFSLFYFCEVETYFYIVILFFAIVSMLLFYYVAGLHAWRIKFDLNVLSSFEKIEGITFGLLTAINNFFYHLIVKLDLLMVGILLSPTDAGIYAIFIFLVSLMEIPSRSVTQISTPLVALYINENNKAELQKIYNATSLNLFIIGSFVFFLILFNFKYFILYIDNIPFSSSFYYVIAFLGLSRLIDMSFGINSQIILFSKKYYVYNILTVLIGFLNLIVSYLLIKTYGMPGISFSVLVSLTLFNLLKYLYIWYEMKLVPNSIGHVKTGIVFILVFVFWFFLPEFENLYVGVLLSTLFVSLLYTILILIIKPSDLLYDSLMKYYNWALKFIPKN